MSKPIDPSMNSPLDTLKALTRRASDLLGAAAEELYSDTGLDGDSFPISAIDQVLAMLSAAVSEHVAFPREVTGTDPEYDVPNTYDNGSPVGVRVEIAPGIVTTIYPRYDGIEDIGRKVSACIDGVTELRQAWQEDAQLAQREGPAIDATTVTDSRWTLQGGAE